VMPAILAKAIELLCIVIQKGSSCRLEGVNSRT
jgi:hypothetical protein